MSIIQQIREKAAWLVFGVIALSLLGFLLMDAFVGKSGRGMMGGNSTTLGTVNGNKIDYIDYEKKIKAQEDQYSTAGYPMNDMMRQNIQEQVWNQYLEENVLQAEADKSGLSVSPKELDDILFGANPPQDLRQQFTNDKGQFDVNAAKAAIANLRKQKNNPMTESFNNQYLPALMQGRLREKYASLLGNTYYIPKWLLEKQTADNSQLAAIKFVNVPYSTVSDSSADVKVSDGEIEDYVSKHKDEYKQVASRSIAYVLFSAAPTQADSLQTALALNNLKAGFETSKDDNAYMVRNASDIPYFDGYVLKSKMQVPNADTIRALADGAVFGPYKDGGNFVLAKMIGKRTMPDSIKVRHILISTKNGVADSTAKTRIDSIENAIKAGADFAELAKKLSEDPGSKDKGGEYEFGSSQFGQFAKEFMEFGFYNKTGDKKVVKTSFGYHYMEILSQKNFEEGYKVAYLAKPINASQETENAASGAANQFSGESRTIAAFDENAKKHNYNRLVAPDVKPTEATVPGIGSSRQLVRWVNDADIGDVSEPFNVDDKYVVAVVTEINKEGTMSVNKARPMVEFLVKNQKKATIIKKKLGTPATIEAAATAGGVQVMSSDSVSFSSPYIPNVGQELKVIGASFAKDMKGKVSAPIAGNGGVFVVRIENISAQTVNANIEQQRSAAMAQAKGMSGQRSLEALKKSADVKDKRAKFF